MWLARGAGLVEGDGGMQGRFGAGGQSQMETMQVDNQSISFRLTRDITKVRHSNARVQITVHILYSSPFKKICYYKWEYTVHTPVFNELKGLSSKVNLSKELYRYEPLSG
jgi:hypothetical protein